MYRKGEEGEERGLNGGEEEEDEEERGGGVDGNSEMEVVGGGGNVDAYGDWEGWAASGAQMRDDDGRKRAGRSANRGGTLI